MVLELTLAVNEVEGKVVHDLNELSKELDSFHDRFGTVTKPLKDGGWTGQAADSFYGVLESTIVEGFRVYASELTTLALLLRTALEEIRQADQQGKAKADELLEAVQAIANFDNL